MHRKVRTVRIPPQENGNRPPECNSVAKSLAPTAIAAPTRVRRATRRKALLQTFVPGTPRTVRFVRVGPPAVSPPGSAHIIRRPPFPLACASRRRATAQNIPGDFFRSTKAGGQSSAALLESRDVFQAAGRTEGRHAGSSARKHLQNCRRVGVREGEGRDEILTARERSWAPSLIIPRGL